MAIRYRVEHPGAFLTLLRRESGCRCGSGQGCIATIPMAVAQLLRLNDWSCEAQSRLRGDVRSENGTVPYTSRNVRLFGFSGTGETAQEARVDP